MSSGKAGSQPIKVLRGINGNLDLYQDRLVLRKSGFFSRLMHNFRGEEKTVDLDAVTGIRFQPDHYRLFSSGSIRVLNNGGTLFIAYNRRYTHRAEMIVKYVQDWLDSK